MSESLWRESDTVNGAQPLDVTTIASKVWEALDPEGQPPHAMANAGGEGEQDVLSGPEEKLNPETLAHIVQTLLARTEHNHRSCERLQQQVQALEEQVRTLPGYIVRLEQWWVDLERRLKRLGHMVELEPTPAAAAQSSRETEEEPEKWLSVKEVANQYNISESTVRRYIRQGRLPAMRLPGGRGLRLRWQDVRERMRPI